jgi:hypothetical protein
VIRIGVFNARDSKEACINFRIGRYFRALKAKIGREIWRASELEMCRLIS